MQRRMNLVLLGILAVALLLAGSVFGLGEVSRVEAEERDHAQLLMNLANITRDYTNDEVRPLIDYHTATFHKSAVPSYASRRITEQLLEQEAYEAYSIREAVLAPINVTNRADDWEAGLILDFIERQPDGGYDTDDLPQVSGTRVRMDQPVFFLAEPIVVPMGQQSCLDCHGAKEDAPQTMLAAYPGAAGFDWVEGQVVGAQVVTVPINLSLKHRRERMATLFASLLAVFTLIYAALNRMLGAQFLAPMGRITEQTERMSRGEPAERLDESLPGEQGRLAAAINRLKSSHDKALELARDADDTDDLG